jgi:hypothetical protein
MTDRAALVCVWLSACASGAGGSTVDVVTEDAVAVDATPDAVPHDAPMCPRPMPLRRAACSTRDQVCVYSCGIVFRCTSIGWDNAFDVDAGPPCP